MNDFIAYYRVSTTKQGISGLGMDAQKNAVAQFLQSGHGNLVAEFEEVESGKNSRRPELSKALAECRRTGARLLIAKLDRLARNAAFLLNLRDSGIDFVACDMPHADKFTVGIMALVAEKERDMISQRTREGLAAAKRRGIKLGNPNAAGALACAVAACQQRANDYAQTLAEAVRRIQRGKARSLQDIADHLNRRGLTTRGGKLFRPQSVKNLLARL